MKYNYTKGVLKFTIGFDADGYIVLQSAAVSPVSTKNFTAASVDIVAIVEDNSDSTSYDATIAFCNQLYGGVLDVARNGNLRIDAVLEGGE